MGVGIQKIGEKAYPIWEDKGRQGKTREEKGRQGKIWEDLGRLGKNLLNLYAPML